MSVFVSPLGMPSDVALAVRAPLSAMKMQEAAVVEPEVEEPPPFNGVTFAKTLPGITAPLDFWDPAGFCSQEGATEGKITDLLQGAPDPLVRAVLVNAVYFKGSWAAKFDPAMTRPGTFHAGGASIPAQFMHRSAKQLPASPSLQALGGAAAVRLDYGHEDGPFAALLVLPADAEATSMAAAVAGLQRKFL